MKRKIDKALDQCAKVPDGTRNCLIVRGIRQCGKTYSIKSFLARQFPENNFAFDFEKDASFKNAILNCQHVEAVLEQLSVNVLPPKGLTFTHKSAPLGMTSVP